MTTCRHKNHINNVYSSDRNIHLGIRHGILCSNVRQAIHPALGSCDPCLERLTSLPSFFLWDSAHADEGKEVAKTDDEEKEESGGAEEEEEEEEPEDVSIHFQAISFNAGTTTISLPVGDISNHILSYHLPPSLDLIQKLQCHTNPSSLLTVDPNFLSTQLAPAIRKECEESPACQPALKHFQHCSEKVEGGKGWHGGKLHRHWPQAVYRSEIWILIACCDFPQCRGLRRGALPPRT